MGDSAAIVLVAVLAFSLIEKIRLVLSGAAAWHPLLVITAGRRRNATRIVGALAVVELFAAGLLSAGSALGAFLAGLLIAGYSATAIGTPGFLSGGGSCACLGSVLDGAGRAFFISRNALLLACAAAAAVAAGPLLEAAPTAGAAGAAALALIALAAALTRGRARRASLGAVAHRMSHAGSAT